MSGKTSIPQSLPALLAAVILVLIGCAPEVPSLDPPAPKSSWELIQQRIFEPKCVACHSPQSTFARQSDLVLTRDQAYAQLINRLPHNPAARQDSLLLLGLEGLKSMQESFLWKKINARDAAHFYADHPEYGALMPMGGPYLTEGELRYIQMWIIRGAPKEGFVVDDSLLQDETTVALPHDQTLVLDPPQSGFQLHVGPFDIAPQSEREIYFFLPRQNPEELFIRRFEVSMRPGSHHFLLHRYAKDQEPEAHVYRDLYDSKGAYNWSTYRSIQDRIYLYGSQYRYSSYSFPEGVALRLPAGQSPEVNVHYVNPSPETLQGEVWVNVHTVPPSEVVHVAENLYLDNRDFRLPPRQTTTVSQTFLFAERRHILVLFSHAHQRNQEFRIYIAGGSRDGELVYFSQDWEHPPMIDFDPPLVLEAGEGLRGEAVYHNPTDKAIKYGPFAGDEMMMILGTCYLD